MKVFANIIKEANSKTVVLQKAESSGGFGTYLVETSEDLDTVMKETLPNSSNNYVISEYRKHNVPLNIHAIITKYDVFLLPPSIQIVMNKNGKLIYSGADFYAYKKYAENNSVVDRELKEYVRWICRSLQAKSYRGVIGFDVIVSEKGIEFVEANNRFQASTVLINKSLKDQRYLTSDDGFPLHRFDGKLISQDVILPSMQALNILAFKDDYDLEDENSEKTSVYKELYERIAKKIDSSFIKKSDRKDTKEEHKNRNSVNDPLINGLINLKIPYSCFIYYDDEKSGSPKPSKNHYVHMVRRMKNLFEYFHQEERKKILKCSTNVVKKLSAMAEDYNYSKFDMERPSYGDISGGKKKGIDLLQCIEISKPVEDFNVESVIRSLHHPSMSKVARLFNIDDYIKDKESEKNSPVELVCAFEQISTIRDNRDYTKNYACKNKEITDRLMRDVDRTFTSEDCTYSNPAYYSIFDNDLKNEPGLDREDYCYPGAYALKLIFSNNIASVLGNDVNVDPNVAPPSDSWNKLITDLRILPIKIGLINNGILLQGVNDIREGVNHSVDLEFPTQKFEHQNMFHESVYINCECNTPSSMLSPFEARKTDDPNKLSLHYYDKNLGIYAHYSKPIEKLKESTKSGVPLEKIAFIATDRIRFQHCDHCMYASKGKGCKFCEFTSKGESTMGRTDYKFDENDINEAIKKTIEITTKNAEMRKSVHIRHVLIGGGTMPGNPSAVKERILSMCRTIQNSRPGTNIYLMTVPPSILSDLNEYKDAGVTEVSFNLEVYDQHLASIYMPGKRSVSTSGYIAALRYATTLWGSTGNVRSALIIGLEPIESAMEGIKMLTSIGVAPILSIFRPTPGTELAWMRPLDSESLYEFYMKADKICQTMEMEFGPACLQCQNNTLALPRELLMAKFERGKDKEK